MKPDDPSHGPILKKNEAAKWYNSVKCYLARYAPNATLPHTTTEHSFESIEASLDEVLTLVNSLCD